ncbi:MAG: 1-deoxy-D-xylulose-5-phosphate reductoisomerase [Campylobacterota bacterium]|nr:1-deoxy-D-xylulose-5-phosphate reductoisomerase [Campylobacterota bacterium]
MILLGSTGSIGVNTLIIATKFNLHVDVLGAGRNIELLNMQIAKHKPRMVVISHEEDRHRVNHLDVLVGERGVLDAIERSDSTLVVNAIVGFAGLKPTLKAIECNKKIALANKESLVAGGRFVNTSNIQPIDSEHFGLWYLMQESKPLQKMTITASGGAFRDWPINKLQSASFADALKHPNWSMGQKITIDSASMVNKLFELLEARWLFGEGEYDAIIETRSLIHALINFKDGSTTAHIANASMQLPIAYAINSNVTQQILEPVDLVKVGSLEFRQIEQARYPIWQIKDEILKEPERGVVINAANEAAIAKFINAEIGFLDISKSILSAYNKFTDLPQNIDDLYTLDAEIRNYVRLL